MFKTFKLAVAAAALAATAAALAQVNYPSRSIRWIVPYVACTSPDNTVRIVAEAMSEMLKRNIIVENKPGAAGNLDAQAAARSAPDGYPWVYSATPLAMSMRTYKKPGFDVMKDFVHVVRIGTSELRVATSPGTGIASMQDLVARARKKPGGLMYASVGIGSPAHTGAELMLAAAGGEATHVPYKGATESTNAVIGKQVDFALAITSVALPQVDNGKLVELAVTSPQRHARLAAAPTRPRRACR
jgi:tripartite-type tricarboxylate transporter receptor subunit TctC